MKKDFRINFDGQTLFKVLQGGSYTVGYTVSTPSPLGISSGVYPTSTFDSKRQSVGGAIYAGFSDAAGPSSPDDLHFALQPGDVVACSSVSGGKITVSINGAAVATIAASAVGGVLGFWA